MYNAKNGESVMSLFGHIAACSAGSFSPDGKTLITASSDKTLKVWELKNQKCTYTIKGHRFHKADILCMAVARKKSLAATGSAFNEVGITNYETGNIVHFFDSGNDNFSIENIAFVNDDNFVVFSSTDHLIRILELQKLTIRTKISLGEENITKMTPSNIYNSILYLGTSFGRFLVFDSKGNGTFKHSEQLHCTGLMDFALTKSEAYVLTSSLDRTINLLRLDAELMELKVTSLFN